MIPEAYNRNMSRSDEEAALAVRPNMEAEISVIGSILLEPDRIMPHAERMLDEADFYFTETRTLYRTCCGYFVDGKPIDVVTLGAQHPEYKDLLLNFAERTPTSWNWEAYARIVADTAKRRRAYERLVELKGALAEGAEIAECQEAAVQVCEELKHTPAGRSLSARDGFVEFYNSLKHPPQYMHTGFSRLDGGAYIERGDYVVIGARPSAGKTAIALQMMMYMCRKYRAVFFSLETNTGKLHARMAANISGISLRDIKTRHELDFGRLAQAGKDISGMNFHTEEAAGWTVAQIKARAVELRAEVIFIDYMGLVTSTGKDRYERVTNTSIGLHIMAQQTGITVFALCQLNRDGKGEPTMEHLRESGQIEQDADVILLLYNPSDQDKRWRRITVAKNKEGATGRIDFDFDLDVQKFYELEDRI